jgi:SpoVK/Ycf46/Vps4 family AAA+-type ATPase
LVVPLPDTHTRAAIIAQSLPSLNVDDAMQLAELSEGYSGADLDRVAVNRKKYIFLIFIIYL